MRLKGAQGLACISGAILAAALLPTSLACAVEPATSPASGGLGEVTAFAPTTSDEEGGATIPDELGRPDGPEEPVASPQGDAKAWDGAGAPGTAEDAAVHVAPVQEEGPAASDEKEAPAASDEGEGHATEGTAPEVAEGEAATAPEGGVVETRPSAAPEPMEAKEPVLMASELAAPATNSGKAKATSRATATAKSAKKAPTAPVAQPSAKQALAEGKESTLSYDDVHRLYNPNSGEHFYTTSPKERDNLVHVGWCYEGVGWIAPRTGLDVFRLYNPNVGDHHYTLSDEERRTLVHVGWRYEGVGWHSAGKGGVPLLREYNPCAKAGAHNFTVSRNEDSHLTSVGWNGEGVAWYGAATCAAASVGSEGGSHEVRSTQLDGGSYLFLPSHATDETVVRFTDWAGDLLRPYVQQGGRESRVDGPLTLAALRRLGSANGQGDLSLSLRMAPRLSPQSLTIMRSARIETIYLSSEDAKARGRAYVEADPRHERKAKVVVSAVDARGGVIYERDDASKGKLSTVKGRGNSTWGIGNKKPYQVSLSKKADLLATGNKENQSKKWVLLANAADPTLMRSSIAYDLARELGMLGVECAPVDLYYDGEYRGSYLLTEKVDVGSGRVDIHKLEDDYKKANEGVDLDSLPAAIRKGAGGLEYSCVPGVRDPKDLSGGYLLELDDAWHKGEKSWFSTQHGHFVLKNPEVASEKAVLHVAAAMREAMANADKGRFNLSDGYSFDLDSLAKTYLLNELLKNVDAFGTSTYCYLDAGSKTFVWAPVWDFDCCGGTRTDHYDSEFSRYEGFSLINGAWVPRIAAVRKRMGEVYGGQLSPLVDKVLLGGGSARGGEGQLRSIAFYRGELAASERMNETVFGITHFDNTVRPFDSWAGNVDYLTTWVRNRNDWLRDGISHAGSPNAPFVYQGFDYGMVFDCEYYLASNPDLRAAFGGSPEAALAHFAEFGMREGRRSSRNFDVRAYRAANPDLDRAFGNDLSQYYRHYCQLGFKEARPVR